MHFLLQSTLSNLISIPMHFDFLYSYGSTLQYYNSYSYVVLDVYVCVMKNDDEYYHAFC